MSLNIREREAVSIVLGSIADRSVLDNSGPLGPAVAVLVDYLSTFEDPETNLPLSDSVIQKMAIAYPLSSESYGDLMATDWCTSSKCPVRGTLVSLDSKDSVNPTLLSHLNANQNVIIRLKLAFVFQADLNQVRKDWIEIAKKIFPIEIDLESDADAMELRLGLNKFIGPDDKGDCKGKTCPGVANVGCC